MEKANEMNGQEVRCDKCGCAFIPEMLTEKDGEIEYSFFRCCYCGKAYMVSVTDEELRKGIREYLSLSALNKVKRLDEPMQFKMQELKAANAEREKALRSACLKEAADEGE